MKQIRIAFGPLVESNNYEYVIAQLTQVGYDVCLEGDEMVFEVDVLLPDSAIMEMGIAIGCVIMKLGVKNGVWDSIGTEEQITG